MAYGKQGVGKDGNRGVHGSGPSGDPTHMPDAWAGSVGSLSAPKGQRLGEQAQRNAGWQNTGQARQDLPGTGEITPREQYNFQSGGEPGLLGQDNDDYGQGFVNINPTRPYPPSVEFPGESGTTNMGQQGDPLDWNAVAPYEYPEFPMQSNAADVHMSADAAPLT